MAEKPSKENALFVEPGCIRSSANNGGQACYRAVWRGFFLTSYRVLCYSLYNARLIWRDMEKIQ